jgi:N-acetylneuraminic acid mutarotase
MKTQSTSRLTFRNLRVLTGFALYAAGMVLAFGAMSSRAAGDNAAAELSQSVPAQAPGRWRITGSMATGRDLHTATLLPNGQVLVAGGSNGGVLASAELYDPATRVWTATGSLATARSGHTATLLSNGQVLVAGGMSTSGFFASAELYDPATGTWAATGSMATARVWHTATLLPNGQVLVAGGLSSGYHRNHQTPTAELYDPASGSWTATASLVPARDVHTATLLRNGRVLVSGGDSNDGILARADLYKSAPQVLDLE